MSWPPLPDEPLSAPPDPDGIRITKRKSPSDYIDGYRAALLDIQNYVNRQIAVIDTVKELQQKVVKTPHEKIGETQQ